MYSRDTTINRFGVADGACPSLASCVLAMGLPAESSSVTCCVTSLGKTTGIDFAAVSGPRPFGVVMSDHREDDGGGAEITVAGNDLDVRRVGEEQELVPGADIEAGSEQC